jgi:hypothetical protein
MMDKGATWLTIHGRTPKQRTEPVDYDGSVAGTFQSLWSSFFHSIRCHPETWGFFVVSAMSEALLMIFLRRSFFQQLSCSASMLPYL